MKCLKCGKEFEGDYCPNCGTKAEEWSEVVLTQTHSDVQLKTIKKKPFYLRWWFFGIVVLVVACFDYFIFGFNKGEMIDWSTIRLNEVLPDPSLTNGEIKENTKENLYIIYSESSMQDYNEYLNAIKKFVDLDLSLIDAFNNIENQGDLLKAILNIKEITRVDDEITIIINDIDIVINVKDEILNSVSFMINSSEVQLLFSYENKTINIIEYTIKEENKQDNKE